MKIAFIGQKGIPASWGGVERHVEELAACLAQNGHEVTVYCRRSYVQYNQPSYRGVNLRFTKSINSKNLDTITHTLTATLDAWRRDFDIIHYHGVGPALLSWIPRIFKPSAKVVVTFHCLDRLHAKWGLLARLMLWLGERAACYFPHETITVSRTLKDYAAEKYHCQARYLPNGVNPAVKIEKTLGLKKFGLRKNQYWLAVSRLVAHKATHNLIQAFKELRRENKISADIKLAIVGESARTDDYVRYLKSLAHDEENIIFTGWQGGLALAELLANAALFIHPSLSEGLPLVVLEAMSYGRPVIVSDIPEHRELIKDPRFVFQPGSVRDLKEKINWAMKNPEIARVAGIWNRQKTEREHSWEKVAEGVQDIYRELTEKASWPVFRVKKLGARI